jgi:hypothetical protein
MLASVYYSGFFGGPLALSADGTALIVARIANLFPDGEPEGGVYVFEPLVFAVNAGGSQYTDHSGNVYLADTDYSGGATYSTTAAIRGNGEGTGVLQGDGTLYQTQRYGNFSYNIPLANGSYNVTLKFAELYWNAAGQRVFDVSMQGQQVISNLDVFAMAPKLNEVNIPNFHYNSENVAYDVTIPATVTNGMLNISFTSVVDNAIVNAIVVTRAPQPTTFFINSGGGQYTDSTGNEYQADTDYSGGSTYSTNSGIGGTPDETLYQTQRYGNFSYNIPLDNGSYNVTLKFAELYWNSSGQRVFDVSMQGQQVISNLDVFALVGKDSAHDVTTAVSVTNGMLTITFNSVVDNAIVNAIEITQGSPTCTVSAPTVSITPASQNITSGGSDTYTISITNNDIGTACTSTTFNLAASDTNSTNFNASTANPGSVTLAPGVSSTSTLTVTAQTAQTSGTDSTTVTVTASGHSNGVSNDVTTTIDTSPFAVFAVNAGGGQYTDTSGNLYQADKDYSGGATYSTMSSIAGTSDPILYQSQRYGNFSYNIPLANGNYNVTLKFAELYWNSSGQRVFDVSMQGTQVISNLDVYALVGKDAAHDVTTAVSVTNGMMTINFNSVADYAIVNAIEITPQ